MAGRMKRKAFFIQYDTDEYDESGDLFDDGITHMRTQSRDAVTIEKKKPRIGRKPNKRPKKSTPNLLMKLSGELRNKIYELSLYRAGGSVREPVGDGDGEKPTILVGYRIVPRPYNRVEKQTPAWRQPGLLQVSKQIRQEASSIYYHTNNFRAVVAWPTSKTPSKIPQAMEWVKRFTTSGPLSSLRIEITGNWKAQIPSFYPIAHFIFENTNNDSWPLIGNAEEWMHFFGESGRGTPFDTAFGSMVKISYQAKLSNVTHEAFQTAFRDWAYQTAMLAPRGSRYRDPGAATWKAIHVAMGCEDPNDLPTGVIGPEMIPERYVPPPSYSYKCTPRKMGRKARRSSDS